MNEDEKYYLYKTSHDTCYRKNLPQTERLKRIEISQGILTDLLDYERQQLLSLNGWEKQFIKSVSKPNYYRLSIKQEECVVRTLRKVLFHYIQYPKQEMTNLLNSPPLIQEKLDSIFGVRSRTIKKWRDFYLVTQSNMCNTRFSFKPFESINYLLCLHRK